MARFSAHHPDISIDLLPAPHFVSLSKREADLAIMPVLVDEVFVTRRFWLCCREDLRKLRRVTSLWHYLRAVADANHAFLMGDNAQMGCVPA